MQLVTFQVNEEPLLGVLKKDSVINLKALSSLYNEGEPAKYVQDMLSLIEQRDESLTYVEKLLAYYDQNDTIRTTVEFQLEDVKLLAPISNPGKVVCVGNNYMDHCREQNVEPPEKPLIFSKWPSCIVGPDELVELPEESEQVDYEAELVVIIGKEGKNIKAEEAFDYVFGYTIMNDISARDVQFADGQWVRGKSFDTFAPLGPTIVTKDEIENPQNVKIKLDVNGETLQDSNTEHMIFDIPYILSYLSKGFTFKPGDVVATGTPHGVGVFREPKIFLKSGDICTIEIEHIGTLKNPIK
ncbi:fumarylacetoacetate hydrolase family protein [Evansella sp. AB-P1]|uniref:fumarylacetoacetate hydrolase family protein n=1 Tax=Evansella sp. AB-P1 TaxID=3037653 RepID=UPI00241F7A42|nr:fumarylacetoacetate hydrolase family protein [Evansella sp. AB-P1]MDG5786742.1 fumarylacetoacetate hydrolase family protein [Evansella sp. AB-P1]